MLKNLIRFGLVSVICGGAIVTGDYATQRITRYESLRFYEAQHYRPGIDIQFAPAELQAYGIALAESSANATTNARTLVWLLAAGLIAIVVSSDGKAFSKSETQFRQFQAWLKAVKANNSLKVAEIETQVQDATD